jgi:cobalamin biosynthesis protein CbiD
MKLLFAEDDPDVTRGVVAIARAAAEKNHATLTAGETAEGKLRYAATALLPS